jgi:hypothetical protein
VSARDPHPRDARLIARHFEAPGDERLEQHVRSCARCAERCREIAVALDDADSAWRHEGAPYFTAGRLAAQRRAVLRDISGRHLARIIPFPRAGAPARSNAPAGSRRSRLAAVAAIVALVGAAGAGWVLETQRHEGLRLQAARRAAVLHVPRGESQQRQEALLSEIELALANPGTPALRALDALTTDAAEPSPGR